MDKLSFVQDGGSKLPLGFRFQPTDEEIVFQYLARKIFCHPLPALVIPEINVFSFDPWELPGDSDQDRYFFSNQESLHRNGNRTGRATCSGFWKVTGSPKKIISLKGAPIFGIRNSLEFYKAKQPRPVKTGWIMHEYCIAMSGNRDSNIQQKKTSKGSFIRIGNWTLCHTILKKRKCIGKTDPEYGNPESYSFITGNMSDTDSSSASSSSPCCDSTISTEVTSSSSNCGESRV